MDMNIRGNLYHIPMENNFIADQLARNAILLMFYSNLNHCGDCPLKVKLCN